MIARAGISELLTLASWDERDAMTRPIKGLVPDYTPGVI